MPIHRRLPKRGFTNIFKKRIAQINIRDLKRFESGSLVDEAALIRSGLVRGRVDGIKLLGSGEIEYPLTVKVNGISKSARQKIESAGGSIEVL
jgi:large subunit ribosomal protein L15